MVLVLASRGLSLVHTCDISISINAGIGIRMCSVKRCDISISISIRKRELFLFNSFIAELAKQWMRFCRDGQNGVSKICVDGCDVVSENSGSDVKLGWI